MLFDGLCSYRTVVRAIELILLSAGIVSTILMFKGAFESCCSYEFFVLTLRKPWFYFRSWLSSPFYICIIMNFIVVFIAASSLFHHHHHKVDNPAASVVDASEEDTVFESSLTQLLSTLPPRDLPPPPPPMSNSHQDHLVPVADDLSSANHHYNDLCQDVQVQHFTFKTESLENPKENMKEKGREKQGQQETAESNAEEEEDDGDRNITMEETWKAISEGENPEKKQLKKSETWPQPRQLAVPAAAAGVFNCQLQEELNQEASAAKKKKSKNKKDLKKSMTFNDTVSVRCRGGLMRDPSMSLEEFNGRVEAFINKFNNEMRLQRQESEQRFLEMINRSI